MLKVRFSPLMPTVAIWVQLAIKHPVPDLVNQLLVIFDIWALWASGLSVQCPDVKNYK